jgi:hypothetical protein
MTEGPATADALNLSNFTISRKTRIVTVLVARTLLPDEPRSLIKHEDAPPDIYAASGLS